jgi:hypothetical protein
MRSITCTALCGLLLLGCSTRVSVVRKERKTAHVRISSSPSGANAYVNRQSVGLTPTRVRVPYTEVERHYEPGSRRTGWLLLVTGALGFAGGLAMMVAGAKSISAESDNESIGMDLESRALGAMGIAFGVPLVLGGGLGLIAGLYRVATGRKPFNEIETKPAELRIGLRLPNDEMRQARLVPATDEPVARHFEQLSALHYDMTADRWSAPGLPTSLRLKARYPAEMRNRARVARSEARPDSPPAPSPPSTAPRVAVFRVENQGGQLPTRSVAQLSEYLATRLAARRDWPTIDRTALSKALRAQRKRTRSRCGTQTCQAAVARSVGAEKMLTTIVAEMGGRCAVTSVLFDVRQDSTESTAEARGGCTEDEMIRAMESVVGELTGHVQSR